MIEYAIGLIQTIMWFIAINNQGGTKVPPPPTPEIEKMIVRLGDDSFQVREKASKDLMALGHDSLKACMDACAKNPCPEITHRAERIINKYYGSAYPGKDGYPSIYLLPNAVRFPFGVKFDKDTEERGEGWCKEMTTPFDIGAYYYAKARTIYNNQLTQEQLSTGQKVGDECWRNYHMEVRATQLYVHDLLYYGKNPKAIQEILKKAEGKRALHRHYGGGSMDTAVPGPAVDEKDVPDSSEYRFQQWWGLFRRGFGVGRFVCAR